MTGKGLKYFSIVIEKYFGFEDVEEFSDGNVGHSYDSYIGDWILLLLQKRNRLEGWDEDYLVWMDNRGIIHEFLIVANNIGHGDINKEGIFEGSKVFCDRNRCEWLTV